MSDCAEKCYHTRRRFSWTDSLESEWELLQCSCLFICPALEHELYVELGACCQGIKTMGPGSSKRNKHRSVLTQDVSTIEQRCPQHSEGSRDVRCEPPRHVGGRRGHVEFSC